MEKLIYYNRGSALGKIVINVKKRGNGNDYLGLIWPIIKMTHSVPFLLAIIN